MTSEPKIVTQFHPAQYQTSVYDYEAWAHPRDAYWSAVIEGWKFGDPAGYGSSEEAAKEALLTLLEKPSCDLS